MAQFDKQLLQVRQAIEQTIASLRKLKQEAAARGADIVTDTQIAKNIRLLDLLERRRELLRQIRQEEARRAAVPGGAPGQAGPGQRPLGGIDNQNEEQRARAEERRRRAEVRRQEEERKAQLLAEARNRVKTEAVYQDALKQARQKGFTEKNLTNIYSRGSDVQRLMFSRQVGGVQEQFNPYVNMKTGKATPGLSSQFRTAGSDILRDIGQFTKWSIAVAAVYTPLQKLGELIVTMIDNESRLADATVAANVSFDQAGKIFDVAAVSANAAGESINGVIDAYAQAIRATGRYSEAEGKTQKAVKLLNDSLILSKLSALDQGQAIDTLSAALLQSDRELDQGQELLNKWVRMSQLANVSIDTLATGVAVLGDAAETSGLSIDQLNALIAVLAEQSISGSKEAANTAKALIGSYQSDKAEQTLNRYGVAVRKANGEAREFLDVYSELAKLREQGLVTESMVSEIALALGGGGTRRAKDASALINSVEKLNQLAKETADINGESGIANEALAKKLETVQTANTRLGNSFQELAQTLGDDGGLLDLFKGLLNLLTGITSATDTLFTSLGRSGPVLATLTTALLASRALISPESKATMLGRLQPQFQGFMGGGQAQFGYGGGARGFGRGVLGDILQMNARGGSIIGGLAVGGAAISNLQAGKQENAAANVIGGLIGGAIGGALSGGIGIAAGAAIGSSAADSMVNGILSHSNELEDFFAGFKVGGRGAEPAVEETLAPVVKSTEELLTEVYKTIGNGNELWGGLLAKDKYLSSQPKIGRGRDSIGYATPEAAALDILKEIQTDEAKALLAELSQRRQVQQVQQGGFAAGTTPQAIAENKRTVAELQKLAEDERTRQLQKVSVGELRPSEFGKISERLTGFPVAAKRQVDAFGEAFIAVSGDIDSAAEAYQKFLEFTVSGTEEQQNQLNAYVADIDVLKAAWDTWTPEGKTLELSTGIKQFTSKEDLNKFLSTVQTQAATFANSAVTGARLQQLKLPGITGSATEATPGTDVDTIRQQAEKLQQQFYTDMKLTINEIEFLRKGLDDFSVLVERAGENHYETITGIDQKFWDAAQKLLVEQGKIKEEKGIGFQKFDVPMSTLQQLSTQSLAIGQSWQKKFNYDFKPEDQIAIDNQGIVQPLHADFKILALLLEKIVEQNQKQLDGQYNIPEGATFWVPLTAAYYRNKGGTGTDGLQSMLDSLAVDTNTSATEDNTAAVRELTNGILQGKEVRGELDKFMLKNQPEDYEKKLAKEDSRVRGINQREAMYAQQVQPEDTKKEKVPSSSIYVPPGLGRTPTIPDIKIPDISTLFGKLFEELKKLLSPMSSQLQLEANPAVGGTNGMPIPQGLSNRATPTSAPTTPTSKLDLKISSNINLMVDGRILASTLQNYLASELLRTEQSQGTVTKRYII